jgi:hypothetical protein
MAGTEEKCVIGIRVSGGAMVKAFDVCIKGEDVYVNYSDFSVAVAHGSYHASGQQHIKIGRKYVEWTGGPTGNMEPMKFFRTATGLISARNDFWTIGWQISKLENILPKLTGADMIVDAQALHGDSILGLEVSIVGTQAKNRHSVVGFPIVGTHRFGSSVCVEIAAFTLAE